MLSSQVSTDLGPDQILHAAESFRGRFIDLDLDLVIGASQFLSRKDWLRNRIEANGIAAGDRVIVAISNGPQFVATLLGILAAHGSPLLLHAKTPASELRRTAQRFGARFIVTDAEIETELAQRTAHCQSISDGGRWLNLLWAEMDLSERDFDDDFAVFPGVPLHPTSGTTGLPKVAVRPGDAAVAEARHYIETIGISDEDTILAVPPMSHAYAFGMGVMVPLLSGANVASMRGFEPKLVFQAFERFGITVFPAVPTMLDVLMFGAGDRLRDGRRTVLTAGSPLPERTARRYHEMSGKRVRPLYGTTETGGITVASPAEAQKPTGCVGQPMRGVEAEVRAEPDSHYEDGIGMLYIRSESMMQGYLGREGADRQQLSDGWFKTGDLGIIDNDGAIHLKARETEVINVSGMKVVPCDVEEVIASLPGVQEAKVYAGANRSGSQIVKAAVVVDAGIDASAIQRYCEDELVYYKRPSQVYLLDALPRSPAGKIARDQLP